MLEFIDYLMKVKNYNQNLNLSTIKHYTPQTTQLFKIYHFIYLMI
jgi:hypothetical protein